MKQGRYNLKIPLTGRPVRLKNQTKYIRRFNKYLCLHWYNWEKSLSIVSSFDIKQGYSQVRCLWSKEELKKRIEIWRLCWKRS